MTRFAAPPVTTWPAAEAFGRVLAGAGATLPRRDAVDRRIVADVTHGTGRVIDSPRDVGGYPRLATAEPPPDADHDGMPDDWERRRGLAQHDRADGRGDDDGDTNLEEYLHELLAGPQDARPGVG